MAPASVLWFRLGSLSKLHRALSPRHTLFVPPARTAPMDDVFAARVESWEECASRVEKDASGAIVQQKRRELHAAITELPPELQAEAAVLAERWRSRRR